MSIKIEGTEVEARYVEYGVRFDDGQVEEMDMVDAYGVINSGLVEGATVVARAVYEMAWAEVTQ